MIISERQSTGTEAHGEQVPQTLKVQSATNSPGSKTAQQATFTTFREPKNTLYQDVGHKSHSLTVKQYIEAFPDLHL